jgi:hypothetical protein
LAPYLINNCAIGKLLLVIAIFNRLSISTLAIPLSKHLLTVRKMFKKRGFEVFLIDEFLTSKLCNECEHETENFLDIPPKVRKKPKKLKKKTSKNRRQKLRKFGKQDGAIEIYKPKPGKTDKKNPVEEINDPKQKEDTNEVPIKQLINPQQKANNKVWKILRCTNGKCGIVHNRDHNACRNMLKIVGEIKKGNQRPIKYCRQEN